VSNNQIFSCGYALGVFLTLLILSGWGHK
jgi:hypothetical protein